MDNQSKFLNLFDQALKQVDNSLSYEKICAIESETPLDDVNKAFIIGALALLAKNSSAVTVDLNAATLASTYGEITALIDKVMQSA